MSIDLLEQTPTFDVAAVLGVDALAPLSMVVQMPGKHYHSQREPSTIMLYAVLENALGWHLGQTERTEIIKRLIRQHGLAQTPMKSGAGFTNLLQYHLRFTVGMSDSPDSIMHYDDYWSQHLRTNGQEFIGGSREYDGRAIPVMNANARKDDDPKKIRFSDKVNCEVPVRDAQGEPVKEHGKNLKRKVSVRKDSAALTDFGTDDVLHYSVVRPYFPLYYVSPTPREYVVPRTPYRYRVETSAAIATALNKAIDDPAAPLYLGSSDGWVDVTWHMLRESAQ